MTTLKKPRAVLFDWDGTLVDSLDSVYACMNLLSDHFHWPHLSPDEIRKYMAIGTTKEMFKTLYPDHVQEALDIYYSYVPDVRAKYVKFISGVQDLLDDLKARNIPMGIVSNMNHPHLVAEAAHLGVQDYFVTIIGAGEAARGKPSPDPVYLALDRMGFSRAEASDVWFVGDMEPDQKAARAAKCPFLYYAGRHDTGLKADYVFTDYGQLKADLESIS